MGSRRTRQHSKIPFAVFILLGVGGLNLLGGGGSFPWGGAGLLIFTGMWLTLRPPRVAPNYLFNLAALGLLVWGVVQMLPLGSPETEAHILWEAYGLDIPEAPSFNRWIHFQGLVFILAGLGFLLICINEFEGIDREGRRVALSYFAFGAGVLSLICYAMNSAGVRYPLNETNQVFSYLPNRNHTGLFCVLGGVIAFGICFERIARKPIQGVIYFGVAITCFLGMTATSSRAAFILFLVGCGMWIFSSLRRQTLNERLKWILPACFLLGAIFFAFGEASSERLMGLLSGDVDSQEMFRALIYQDVFSMLKDVPFLGVGWGGFRYVFPHYRDASLNFQHVYHPESDYLWIWTEGGLIALVLVFLLIFSLIRGGRGGEQRPDRFQKLAMVTVFLITLHALVDVPFRETGILVWMGWILGIAAIHRTDAPSALFLPSIAWRAIGTCIVLVGCILAAGRLLDQPWSLGSVRIAAGESLTTRSGDLDRSEDRKEWLESAAAVFPLEWGIHSELGRLYMAGGSYDRAELQFDQARVCQPDLGVVTWIEGLEWLYVRPGRAVDSFGETFVDRKLDDAVSKFHRVWLYAEPSQMLRQGLARVSRGEESIRRKFFEFAEGEVAVEEIEYELAKYPFLERWSAAERDRLWFQFASVLGWHRIHLHFSHYWVLKHREPVIWAMAIGETEGWEAGVGLISEALLPPIMSDYGRDVPLNRLRARFSRNPADMATAIALIREYAENGLWNDVLKISQEYEPRQRYPALFYYWRARALTELGRNEEAGVYWKRYISQLVQDGARLSARVNYEQ